MTCNCKACNDLREECGEHFPIYAKKLLIRGRAGVMSPVERAYMRAHRSEAQQVQAAAARDRLKTQGFATSTPSTDASSDAGQGVIGARVLTTGSGGE